MPNQILPITGFDQQGVVIDTPPVALPPNAITDCRNVRFKDGAVRKMEGEVNIFPNFFDRNNVSFDDSTMKYIAWWPNPNLIADNQGYYLIIKEEDVNGVQRDVAYLVSPSGQSSRKGDFTPDREANWQHTFFQGGFSIIINNGLDTPHYIIDVEGNNNIDVVPSFVPLPGWESYQINETTIDDVFNEVLNEREFIIGNPVDFDNFFIEITVEDTANDRGITYRVDGEGTFPSTNTLGATASYFESNGLGNIAFNDEGLPNGARVIVQIRSINFVQVRAGVIRAFGDFLVAGNFSISVENPIATPGDPQTIVIRNLAGVVRTSDVATPGTVPTNWNPYAGGVSTADEFVLTSTGVVQEMVELQGNLYIYSNSSISVMRPTGNPNVPLAVQTVTESYGAQTTEAVLEYDGKHFVVGSQDMYLFGGHPSSIQSVSDARVRRYFFENLNPLHNQRMFTIRYAQRDEIWVCYPTTESLRGECNEALIWNYRTNIWTIRDLTSAVSGDVGPVPGGGLPTSFNTFSGDTGSNEEIQGGVREQHVIEFPDQGIQIQPNHGGQTTEETITTRNLFPFESTAASFEITFGNDFDSGPNFNPDAINFATRAINFSVQLLESSDPNASVTVDLPRYLTIDRQWESTRIYFAGEGSPGQPGYYPGQRVIDTNTAGDQVVYRVLNGFGDRTTPSSLYDPNQDGPFYQSQTAFVYHDTLDIVGIPPRFLVHGAPYGTVPGDGGSDNSISASQARWEELGPVANFGFGIDDVARLFEEALQSDSTFNQFFRVIDTDVSDGTIIVEALQSSGVGGYPTYSGIITSFGFPPINNPNNDPVDTNGGNMTDVVVIPSTSGTVTHEGAVSLEFFTTERVFIPFDPEMPDTTGRYATDLGAEVLDRVIVAFNERFDGTTDQINTRVSTIIRETFDRDPTNFWTVDQQSNTVTRLTSNLSGNFELQLVVNSPEGINLTSDNFLLVQARAGTRATDGSPGSIPEELPHFFVVPPDQGFGERPGMYFTPVGLNDILTTADRQELMQLILQEATTVYRNWEANSVGGTHRVNLTTIDDDNDPDLPARLRVAERPSVGSWTVTVASPGNTVNENLFNPSSLGAISMETVPGSFALRTTPSYLGILVSNPTTESGFEFLVLEAGDPNSVPAQTAVDDWTLRIRNAIPRIALQSRAGGFFLQPANYDSLANFILDVRLNDTPQNAEWIYQLATNGVNPETGVTGITLNSGSSVPLNINGSEADNVFIADTIPTSTDRAYLRAGGPLKVAQAFDQVSQTNIAANIRLSGQTTLIFDIFRPWPQDEINQNLEYPLFATVFLKQDDAGIFRRLNKITAADIGWSKPSYEFTPRSTTDDLLNFREIIDMGTDDFPIDYESYFERTQLALQPEFDTEQLQSIALWADGSTPEFLRATPQNNQLDVRVRVTNNPGETVDLSQELGSEIIPGKSTNRFNVSSDYKVDFRVHGRFINYRITDGSDIIERPTEDGPLSHQSEWRISGMQADVRKGGTR